jgi:hypothetical protein
MAGDTYAPWETRPISYGVSGMSQLEEEQEEIDEAIEILNKAEDIKRNDKLYQKCVEKIRERRMNESVSSMADDAMGIDRSKNWASDTKG